MVDHEKEIQTTKWKETEIEVINITIMTTFNIVNENT